MYRLLWFSFGCMVAMVTIHQSRSASVDNSKVVGINSSSVTRTTTIWRHSNYSQCSVTCGTGTETSTVHCYNTTAEKIVIDRLCKHSTKPVPLSHPCIRPDCAFLWIVGEWRQCSVPCGGGVRERDVYCVRESADGSVEPSASNATCSGPRPEQRSACNEERCSSVWFTGKWSECVVPCGDASAYQLRAVSCSDDVTSNCAESERPRSWRSCQSSSVTSPCYQAKDTETSALHKIEFEPPPQEVGEPQQLEDNFDIGSGESLILGLRGTSSEESKEISSEPSFMVSSWGPCSATCGLAVRTRRIQCRAFVESLMSVQDLPDSRCPGEKPVESEYCSLPECSEALAHEAHSWSFNGFGPCSKSCAAGTQDPVFICVRKSDFTTVKADKCSRVSPPAVERRTCNRQACPARWRSFPNGPCSAPCGGGQQRLLVQCVREAALTSSPGGAGGSLFDDDVVADEFCNSTSAPARTLLCNLAPCAPTWSIDSWSECSSSCGDGVQTRQIRCVQKTSPYNIATVNDSFCRGVASTEFPLGTSQLRPESERVCNLGECQTDHDGTSGQHQRASVIVIDPTIFTQLVPSTRVSLDVGGTATLIPGLTINVHCPVVKGFSRQKITWRRPDDVVVTARGRVKVSSPGSIRIRKSRPADAGLYTCVAGQDSASVEIAFHSEDEALSLMIAQRQMISAEDNKDYIYDNSEEPLQYDGDPELPADPHDARRRLNGPNPESVPLTFVPGPWSECSRTCGGAGIHSRQVTCEVRGAVNYRLIVDDSHCDRRQIVRPVDQRDCGFTMCPTWQTGPWSECTSEYCAGIGIGTRQRPTFCIGFNGILLNSTQCPLEARPEDREPCPHISGCHTIWVPSNWSKCSVSCGGRGVRSRRLHCIWVSSKQIADSQHCEHLPSRPPTSKSCFAPPCMDAGCRDESKYCSLIPTLHMCRYPQYRRECCHSCSRHGNAVTSSSPPPPPPASVASRRSTVQ